jgi:hypothetical protein
MNEMHSVKAPDAPEAERKVRTFRVLQRDELTVKDVTRWVEQQAHYTTVWTPAVEEVGEQYGEGDYLLIEIEDKYDFRYVYPMRVVADRVYRLADEDA